jgi:transposase
MAEARNGARTRGKSDPIDALAIARAALREPDLPAAVHDETSRELNYWWITAKTSWANAPQ